MSPRADDVVLGNTAITFAVAAGEPSVERIDVYVDGALIGAVRAPEWSLRWQASGDADQATITAAAFAHGRLLEQQHLEVAQHRFEAQMNVVSVQLYPVVRRGKRYVTNLGIDDFEILDEGRPVPIESFERGTARVTVALVLDVSASMEDRLAFVQQATVRFLDRLDRGDDVCVYAFHHALREVIGPTTDHDLAIERVLQLTATGGTAIYDAVVMVLDELRSIPGRKVVLLFSDGADERSVTSSKRASERARQSETIVYAVGALAVGESVRSDLVELARATGGEAHFVTDPGALPAVFEQILDDVKSQYALSFSPLPGPRGVRRVEVRTNNPRDSVRCRQTYEHGAEPGSP